MSTFPTSVTLTAFKLTPTFVTYTDYALSGFRQARKQSGQLWSIEATTPPLPEAIARELFAFFMAQEGRFGVFTLLLPRFKTPLGLGTGTPLANGAAAAGSSSLATDGWTVSATVLRKGDLLKFASHHKVYVATEDIISDAGGNAVVTFKPALFAAVANNEALTVNNVPFRVAFAEDSFDFQGELVPYSKFTLLFKEVWNS